MSAIVIQGMPVVVVDGEPRVSHVDLAKRLGYAKSNNFAKLIVEHIEKLKAFGVVSSQELTPSKKGGRPGVVWLLNQKQVIALCPVHGGAS